MEEEQEVNEATDEKPAQKKARQSSKKRKKRRKTSKRGHSTSPASRKRLARPYPASPFQEALPLAEAIHQYAAGERVRRLTLLKQLEKSPTSSGTRMLITNSTRYGLTVGGYEAEWLELTELGAVASDPNTLPREKLAAQFKLAIENVAPFQLLYSEYRGKKLPFHDVLKDALMEAGYEIEKLSECVDLFIVNIKSLGLLQTIAGSETLISIEQALDEIEQKPTPTSPQELEDLEIPPSVIPQISSAKSIGSRVNWAKTCFVISPIGEDGSEIRKHADLFLSHLIEPALKEFDLDVVRADKIGAGGMISSQILEYLMRARLAIADLSYHNPNAFYEMAIRHACGLPIVQISRRHDKLPFDVNQVRTVVIDTTDIYTLVPRLETYRSEIATQVRAVLLEGNTTGNPISVFFPGFQVVVPKEK